MLTLDKLREFGADVDDALVRCMNKEDFYIMLVSKAVSEMTELLRSASDTDYSALMEEAKTQFRKLCEL